MTNNMVVDASRGTALWGINRFRSDALAQLMNDLLYREKIGLIPDECDKVKIALGEIVNIASAIPDGSWFRDSIWAELQEFADIYEKWNSHSGTDPDSVSRRKKELRELRDKRNKIARKIRKNQYVLQNDLDLQLVSDMYGAFGSLAKALPDIFSNLANAIARFEKGKD